MAKAKQTAAPAPATAKRTPAQSVALFIKLRDHKKASDEEYKKSMERVNTAMEKLEGELLQYLNDNEVTSVRADGIGTAYRTTRTNATVEDRKAFLEWLESTGETDALDVKANKTYVETAIANGEAPPPGVKITQMHTIGVRRS